MGNQEAECPVSDKNPVGEARAQAALRPWTNFESTTNEIAGAAGRPPGRPRQEGRPEWEAGLDYKTNKQKASAKGVGCERKRGQGQS